MVLSIQLLTEFWPAGFGGAEQRDILRRRRGGGIFYAQLQILPDRLALSAFRCAAGVFAAVAAVADLQARPRPPP